MITNSQRNRARHFRDNGYLRVPDLLTAPEVDGLKQFVYHERAKEIQRLEAADDTDVHKLYGLYDRNPKLMHRLITHPKLIGQLVHLLGPNLIFVKNRHNHAMINGAAKKVEGLHRDILQPTRGLLTALVYLEDATPENGCTHIIPGSQRLDYVGVPQADGGGTWMAEHEEYAGLLDQALPVPVPAGGALLFDGLAFHMGGVNTSTRTRSSITLGYRSVDELAISIDPNREILVAGEDIYRGNDQ